VVVRVKVIRDVMEQNFSMPIKADSLNPLINALVNCLPYKRRWVVGGFQKKWKAATKKHGGKLKTVCTFPAQIQFYARFKFMYRRDICDLYCKSIIDQLVEMGIFPDDNVLFINNVSYGGEIGAKTNEIEVKIISP